MKFLKENSLLVILLLISAFAYQSWFTFSIFQYSDWNYLSSETLAERIHVSTWAQGDLGSYDVTLWRKPLEFTYSAFGAAGYDSAVADFYLVFIPIIFGPMGVYLFLNLLFRSKISAFVGSLVFSFNSYFIAINTQGHELITAASFLSIFAFYHVAAFVKQNNYRSIILAVIFLVLTGIYDFRFLYIDLIVLGLYLPFHALRDRNIGRLVKIISIYPIVILIFAFWILPTVYAGSLASNTVLARGLFGSHFFDILHAVALHHPFWNMSKPEWFTAQRIPFYYWIIPFAAFVGLIINRKRKAVTFFGILGMIGILLSKQAGAPFQYFYQYLYEQLPGFNAFREATKFYYLIAISYSVLIASLVQRIWSVWNRGRIPVISKYAVTTLICFLAVANTVPLITGEVQTMFTRRSMPAEYVELNDYMKQQSGNYKTLWFPRDSRWGFHSYAHPKMSAINLLENRLAPIVEQPQNRSIENRLMSVLNSTYSNSLLDSLSVKHVIVPLADKANDDDFFVHYGGSTHQEIREWYIRQLDDIGYLKRIDIGTDEIILYENIRPSPNIAVSSSLVGLNSLKNFERKVGLLADNSFGSSMFIAHKAATSIPRTDIESIFENINAEDITEHKISVGLETGLNTRLVSPNENIEFDQTAVVIGEAHASSTGTRTTALDGQNSVEYVRNRPFVNAIANSSFELGPWQERVGDCNAYDDNPEISMRVDTNHKSEGNQSLSLEAARHTACTAQSDVSISPDTYYLLSFDYQSPNGKEAGYYLEFKSASTSPIHERIRITDGNWHRFNRIIRTPSVSTEADLYIYSYPTDGVTNNVVRYDDFHLIELPEDIFDYWLISEPGKEFVAPKDVAFKAIHPTRKSVSIRGATTPFYLSMSESYHTDWKLEFNNQRIWGRLSDWVPWAKPDLIPDEHHFELNGFLNGWYVDVDEYCRNKNLCTKNSDGSYNMEMVIEFWPQRWFYVGSLISGTTLALCLGYLLWDYVQRRHRTVQTTSKHEHLTSQDKSELV